MKPVTIQGLEFDELKNDIQKDVVCRSIRLYLSNIPRSSWNPSYRDMVDRPENWNKSIADFVRILEKAYYKEFEKEVRDQGFLYYKNGDILLDVASPLAGEGVFMEPLCHGLNPRRFTIQVKEEENEVDKSGFRDLRVLFLQDQKVVADVFLGLSDCAGAGPRVLSSVNAEPNFHKVAIYPLREIDKAVDVEWG